MDVRYTRAKRKHLDKRTHVLPCWEVGKRCPNSCAQAVMDQITTNHVALGGDWFGWRMAGKDLVSPEGTRISPTRMKGILWRIQAEERLAKAAARNTARKAVRQGDVKVLVVPNEDWHRRHFGTSAG